MDFTKLKALLDAETFPHRYLHKFIGIRSEKFLDAVSALEQQFPRATRKGVRESADSKGTTYIALTFEFNAHSSDEIIELLEATMRLPDLKIIL